MALKIQENTAIDIYILRKHSLNNVKHKTKYHLPNKQMFPQSAQL